MARLDLTSTLKTLQAERVRRQKDLANLDKAIDAIREFAGAEPTPDGRPGKRTVSVSARRKMAKAQKLRWAKVRAQKKSKA